ncbi:MAG: ATP-binding protein [Anaeroplasma bactoclasticum]|nr:ATP-binding protein [Anaeroplasma bactoclasticum]MCM1557512.1 ATP-binding protein [Anaeroplasma bactoclasticum]
MLKFARTIESIKDAENFCKNILFYNEKLDKNAIEKIFDLEVIQKEFDENSSTMYYIANRLERWRDDKKREELREQIAKECISYRRLDDEKSVRLGKGGFYPNTELKRERIFYCLIGLPGSGKSTISSKLSDYTGSFYLDSDIVKRKIPEFKSTTQGSLLVHEESNYILRSSKTAPKYNIMNNILRSGANIVYNMVGNSYTWLKTVLDVIKEKGYSIKLILVELDRVKCVKRVYKRFCETKRYISLPLIFDGYSNDPTITYYKMIENGYVKEYAHLSNDVELGNNPNVIANTISGIDFRAVFNFQNREEQKNEKKQFEKKFENQAV